MRRGWEKHDKGVERGLTRQLVNERLDSLLNLTIPGLSGHVDVEVA